MVAVTVVIACRNMEATLGETLAGIVSQRWVAPWEVILADNGSSDSSVALFRKVAAETPDLEMRLVDASGAPGKSHALNVAVAAARGRSILLNDADDVMAPGYVATMSAALREHDLVGGGNEFARLNPGWVGSYRGNAAEIRTLPVARFPPFLPFVGGNSMGFSRKLFDVVGGFRRDFEPLEDLDFCFRAQRAGYRVHFVPAATMHYRFRADPEGIRRQAYAYARTQVKLAREHRGEAAGWAPPWRRYLRAWPGLAGVAARQALSRRPDPEGRARLAWRLGWQLGQTAGVLAHRGPPSSVR